ncbi:hypothetical protein [Oceanobacillus sp. J11TS1]|uniref:hypothetical protein n=1 Tax=Oceanobacillus sp. J11TS1 TaxID=2807191 RepID=UPI001BB42198|nr:hypothetical protein [Oceanobacillus sp. J11TS1]
MLSKTRSYFDRRQEKKVFLSEFQPKAAVILINGAASDGTLLQSESFDLENYA